MYVFQKDAKLTLRVTVKDPEKAGKLIAWLNPVLSSVEYDDYGCDLTSIHNDVESKYVELLRPFVEAVRRGEF